MKNIYFVGIKGVAMAALSIYCQEKGMKVAGCDTREEFPTDEELQKAKIQVEIGFNPKFLKKPDLVIYTGAHGGRDNPAVAAAEEKGIPTMPHGKALGMFMEGYRQITIAGSHGKTTTAAMIATILRAAGRDPSYAIGCGSILRIGAAGHCGSGDFFVAEGDEYVTDHGHDETPRFLWQKPEVLVVTNIDFDHPDAYLNLTKVQDAFVRLQKQSSNVIVNIDDKNSRVLKGSTFGFLQEAETRIVHTSVEKERTFFSLEQNGRLLGQFSLKVPGQHNIVNATAAISCCQFLGLTFDEIRKGLLAFSGTKRRFEKIGETKGVIYYDDYAHHPAEIKATLAAARKWYPKKKIIAVFQPHTYSRTKALLSQFAKSFVDADVVILADIYASARESDTLGITGKTLFEETLKNHRNVLYGLAIEELLNRETSPNSVVIFMGAGDIYSQARTIWKKNLKN